MIEARSRRQWDLWIEPALALSIAVALGFAIASLLTNGYFPEPFFYEPADSWMDWFNTAYWAHDHGMYDAWGTLYPPLSFVFLKLAGLPGCYTDAAVVNGTTSYSARACDWLGAAVFHFFFILNIFLISRVYIKVDRRTSLSRSIALAAGLPMLEALERGNLIIVCFTCFLLAHGPLLRSARARWLALGLAVNFKVYLIASIFPYLLRRRWLWFEGALISVIGVYFVTWGILGRGTLIELYNNITAFNDISNPTSFLDVWYAATYQAVIALLKGSQFPIVSVIGSGRLEFFLVILPLALAITQASIVLAALGAWLRPEAVTTFRLVNLGTALALITAESGGYTAALMIYLTFFERWEGFGRRWAIVASYLISIPADIYISPLVTAYRAGFLEGPSTFYTYWLSYGPFIRPGLVMSLPFALACVTIRDVWLDIRAQGWRERRRFRHDLPLLTGGGRAETAVPAE